MTTPAGTLPESVEKALTDCHDNECFGGDECLCAIRSLRTAILAALAACKRETARECAEWADAEARDCGCADRIKTRIVTAFGLTGEE